MDMFCTDCESVSMAEYEADEDTVVTICPECDADTLLPYKQWLREEMDRALRRGDDDAADRIGDYLDRVL